MNTVCLMIKLNVKRNFFFSNKGTLEINYSNSPHFAVDIIVIMKFCNFFLFLS